MRVEFSAVHKKNDGSVIGMSEWSSDYMRINSWRPKYLDENTEKVDIVNRVRRK